MENINKEYFEGWMERIMDRFDMLEADLKKSKKVRNMFDGQVYLDNQDLCFLLDVSKRTLQRYRSTGLLPYSRINNTTLYKEKDVLQFIKDNALNL